MFKRVTELKFFSRAISSDKKVEKEIEIQREAIQLTDGAGRSSREILNVIVVDAYAKVK